METVRLFTATNHDLEHSCPNEVPSTIKNLENNKAPVHEDGVYVTCKYYILYIGFMVYDHIPNIVLKILPKRHIVAFCNIINAMMHFQYFPESIILRRLSKFVKEFNILPNFQHWVRHQHSTSDQLLRISEQSADNLNKRKHTSMLLLDDKLAFDRAWHEGLIYKLIILNCPHYLILGLVQSFLWDRSFRVRWGQSPSNPSARNNRRSSRFQVIPDPL